MQKFNKKKSFFMAPRELLVDGDQHTPCVCTKCKITFCDHHGEEIYCFSCDADPCDDCKFRCTHSSCMERGSRCANKSKFQKHFSNARKKSLSSFREYICAERPVLLTNNSIQSKS